MANLRNLKKEIDYRLEEVVFDCDMAICFQPSKEKEIFAVMQEAVAVRNDLFAKAMNPAEPHNASLVRKHYAALRAEMDDVFGKLFEKLSQINAVVAEATHFQTDGLLLVMSLLPWVCMVASYILYCKHYILDEGEYNRIVGILRERKEK